MKLNDQKRKELMQHVEEILVPHTAFNDALDQLEQGMRVASIIRDPLGYFISGESRTGKSRVIEEFKGRHTFAILDTDSKDYAFLFLPFEDRHGARHRRFYRRLDKSSHLCCNSI